jgi:plasmid stabilization system protein ParE
MEGLCDYPRSGAPHEVRQGMRSLAVGSHRVFYRIEDNAVAVVRVLHKAVDTGQWV